MTTGRTIRDLRYSLVEYLPDPAHPEQGRILLGIVFDGRVGKHYIVGLRARLFLTDEELKRLDGIGRELLKQPIHYLRREIESKILPKVRRPGDALELMSEWGTWYLRVSPAKKMEIQPRSVQHVREAISDRMDSFFAKLGEETGPLPWAQRTEWEVSTMSRASGSRASG